MKIFLPVIMFFAAAAFASAAVTNALKPVVANPARSPFKLGAAQLRPLNTTTNGATEILSKSASFDLKSHTAIYVGDVRVRDPRMELACESLTVKLAGEGGGKFQSVVAETNVTIDIMDEKGQRVHCTGGRATYTYVRETMELTDNPRVWSAQGWCSGDVITYDRVNNTIRVTNPHTEFASPTATPATTH